MRILLPKGNQRKFMEKTLKRISVSKAAAICNLSERTIRDWRREKFLMQKNAMLKLCKAANIAEPENFEEKDDYWYVAHGSSAGALACIKKYGCVGGDPTYRKRKWHEWWNKKGRHNQHGCIIGPLAIRAPKFSADLAEFTGIVIGDGGITTDQVIISMNSVDDNEYSFFVKKLIKKLFDLDASMVYRKKELAVYIMISRKKLVEFCNKKLGVQLLKLNN